MRKKLNSQINHRPQRIKSCAEGHRSRSTLAAESAAHLIIIPVGFQRSLDIHLQYRVTNSFRNKLAIYFFDALAFWVTFRHNLI